MGAKVVPATTPNQWQGFKFSTFQELDYATASNGSFYRRGRTLQKRSIKRGGARAQARARTRIRREQKGQVSHEEKSIARSHYFKNSESRRSLSIDRLVKITDL
jgi:hypothetical protein